MTSNTIIDTYPRFAVTLNLTSWGDGRSTGVKGFVFWPSPGLHLPLEPPSRPETFGRSLPRSFPLAQPPNVTPVDLLRSWKWKIRRGAKIRHEFPMHCAKIKFGLFGHFGVFANIGYIPCPVCVPGRLPFTCRCLAHSCPIFVDHLVPFFRASTLHFARMQLFLRHTYCDRPIRFQGWSFYRLKIVYINVS